MKKMFKTSKLIKNVLIKYVL